MTVKAPLLICNPDQPGWKHGEAHVGAIADYCRHKIRISAAGVGRLLLTPGLETVCVLCVPRDSVSGGVLPEVAEQFKAETGRELTPELAAKVETIIDWIKLRNPPRR